MRTFYLVDFENVHTDGLRGCGKLGEDTEIVIFFTQNAHMIDMSLIAHHGFATLRMIEVAAGKQSADMHISSYAGYLIGKYGTDCRIVVVSNDADYDTVLAKWAACRGVKTLRVCPIGEDPALCDDDENTSSSATEQDDAITEGVSEDASLVWPQSDTDNMEAQTKSRPVKKQSDVSESITKALRGAKYNQSVVDFVVPVFEKNRNKKQVKMQVYRALVKEYKQHKGLAIYRLIKPLLP